MMKLNIKELEDALDSALENETKETLTEWIRKERSQKYSNKENYKTFE